MPFYKTEAILMYIYLAVITTEYIKFVEFLTRITTIGQLYIAETCRLFLVYKSL